MKKIEKNEKKKSNKNEKMKKNREKVDFYNPEISCKIKQLFFGFLKLDKTNGDKFIS